MRLASWITNATDKLGICALSALSGNNCYICAPRRYVCMCTAALQLLNTPTVNPILHADSTQV